MVSAWRGSSTSSHWPFLFSTVLKWLIHSAQCCITISDHLCLGSGERREIMTITDDVACAGYWLPVDCLLSPNLPFFPCFVIPELCPENSSHLPTGTVLSFASFCGCISGGRNGFSWSLLLGHMAASTVQDVRWHHPPQSFLAPPGVTSRFASTPHTHSWLPALNGGTSASISTVQSTTSYSLPQQVLNLSLVGAVFIIFSFLGYSTLP